MSSVESPYKFEISTPYLEKYIDSDHFLGTIVHTEEGAETVLSSSYQDLQFSIMRGAETKDGMDGKALHAHFTKAGESYFKYDMFVFYERVSSI